MTKTFLKNAKIGDIKTFKTVPLPLKLCSRLLSYPREDLLAH